jgi:hypothetical protein
MKHTVKSSSRSTNRFKGMVCVSLAALFVLTAFVLGCGSGDAPPIRTENEGVTPAADPIGERLFLDTRFAK